MICHTLHLIIIRHFQMGQGRIANYTGVINNWKDEFTDAMNMVYVTFYSLTRQPLVHQEESVF